MILIKHISDLQKQIKIYKSQNLNIGFVPTMGALHQGHISLIETSCNGHQITVCSIFINPTQFNNPDDYNRYPVTLEKDIEKLEAAGCDLLFLPSIQEMYPPDDTAIIYELGYIETLLEGKFRPGHFQGVCRIVDKLLTSILPHTLYLGQKDYQQCMVIKNMIALKNLPVFLNICETLREADGLAMSSRNIRLDAAGRKRAVGIIDTLTKLKEGLTPGGVQHIIQQGVNNLTRQGFRVDYLEIADANTLQSIEVWDGQQKAVALAAAFINEVRLIDNLLLN